MDAVFGARRDVDLERDFVDFVRCLFDRQILDVLREDGNLRLGAGVRRAVTV
jgi:hypothetical protein